MLSGTLAVQETAGQTLLLQEPVVTVNPPSRAPVTLNSSDVNCPSLTLPANGQLSCAFSAAYTGNQPMPGTVTASISTTDGSSTATAANVPYNFAGADSVGVGQTAAITNWFEQGANVIQVRWGRWCCLGWRADHAGCSPAAQAPCSGTMDIQPSLLPNVWHQIVANVLMSAYSAADCSPMVCQVRSHRLGWCLRKGVILSTSPFLETYPPASVASSGRCERQE